MNEVYIVSDTLPFSTLTEIQVTNETDSTIQFNWSFVVYSTVTHLDALHLEFKDLNICWHLDFVDSNCGLQQPNTLEANETGTVAISSFIYNEYDWEGPISGMINLYSYPSCLIEYDRLVFNINKEITSTNDLEESQVVITPNPFHDVIELDIPKNSIIKVLNSQGQYIFENFTNHSITEINSNTWPSGVYFINITNSLLEVSSTQILIKP